MMTRIEALRQIVATKKAAKLDGHVVDTFTASRLLESYKSLDGAGRRKFASMPVHKMVTAGDNGDDVDRMLRADRDEALKYVDKAVERVISAILQADKDFLGVGVKADEVQAQFSKPLRLLFKSAIRKKWPRPNID
jgi:hypothetical protein